MNDAVHAHTNAAFGVILGPSGLGREPIALAGDGVSVLACWRAIGTALTGDSTARCLVYLSPIRVTSAGSRATSVAEWRGGGRS